MNRLNLRSSQELCCELCVNWEGRKAWDDFVVKNHETLADSEEGPSLEKEIQGVGKWCTEASRGCAAWLPRADAVNEGSSRDHVN